MKKIYFLILLGIFNLAFSQSSDVKPTTTETQKSKVSNPKDFWNNDVRPNITPLKPQNQTKILGTTDVKQNETSSIDSKNFDGKTSDLPQPKNTISTVISKETSDVKLEKISTKTETLDTSTNDFGKKTSPQNISKEILSPSCSFTGRILDTDAVITSRLLRPGSATGSCSVAYTAPSISGAGSSYYYDVYYLKNNTGTLQCVTFSLNHADPAANLQFAVYKDNFNPGDLTQNYMGDPGLSSGTPATITSCSINVPADTTVVIVVFNINASQGMTVDYTLTETGIPCAPTCSVTNRLLTTDATMTSRLLRPGAPTGNCGVNYSAPSVAGAGSSYYYKKHFYKNNTGSAQCVTFTLNHADAAANLQFAVYNGSFNPADVTQNYLADPGISSGTPATATSCTVTIPSGAELVVVVFNVNASQAMTADYTLSETGLPCPETCSTTSRLNTTDATMTSRLLRPGAATGSCDVNYSAPSVAGAGSSYYYKKHFYKNNTGSAQCVTFTLNNADADANLQFAIYNDTFNPADVTQNYLADPGVSSGTPAVAISCTVTIPSGATVVLVVFNVNASQTMTTDYTITETGLPCPAVCNTYNRLLSTDSVMTSRLLRPGAATGSCGTNYSAPSVAGAGSSYYYKKHLYSNNTGSAQCVTFTLNHADPAANLQFAVYSGSFNPADITQNYLADPGVSSGTPATATSCTVTIPNGTNIEVVVFNVNASQAMTADYTLSQSGLPCGTACVYYGRLTASSGTMPQRLFRDANHTVCGTSKGFPGNSGIAVVYKTHKITNTTGASQCVTVKGSTTDAIASGVHISAYNGSFNPADLSQNYLADSGTSLLNGAPTSFNFTMTNGQTVVLVTNTIVNGEYMTSDYTLEVTGLDCATSCGFTGQITATTPTMANRLLRNAIHANCEVAKSFPGTSAIAVSYQTKVVVNNTGSAQCFKVRLSTTDAIPSGIHVSAYNNSFDSNNLATNYLADSGESAVNGTPSEFNVNVPNNGKIVLVMNNNSTGAFMTGLYDIEITEITCNAILAAEEVPTDLLKKTVYLYPNPVQNTLNVKGITLKSIKIFDMSGKLIPLNFTGSEINVTQLKSGIYVVQMEDKNGNIVMDRFIKN